MVQYTLVEVSSANTYIALMATLLTRESAATGLSEQLMKWLLFRSLQCFLSSFVAFVASERKEGSACYYKFSKCSKVQHISSNNLLYYSNPMCSNPTHSNRSKNSYCNSKVSSTSSSSSSWSISSRRASSQRFNHSRWWEWVSSLGYTR